MEDYAAIIRGVLEENDMVGAPVVTLGGSYSGKLSAYMRLKYPFLVSMALAASAPIYLDSVGLTSSVAYYNVVEAATTKISPKCPAAVKAAFSAYEATPSPAARQKVPCTFNSAGAAGTTRLCPRVHQMADDLLDAQDRAVLRACMSAPHFVHLVFWITGEVVWWLR